MKIRNMVLAGLFAALLAICAWISLPLSNLRFTLQTFGLYLALLTLGGKWGSITVLVYIALGCVGLPVFSGFQGGLGILIGPTGGFLVGFMLTALLYWLATAVLGQHFYIRLAAAILGLLLCYFCGWLWFSRFAAIDFFAYSLAYLLPDAVKLFLAFVLSRRLRPLIQE